MAKSIARRSKDDEVWQALKKVVDKRDVGCQVSRCLTVREAAIVGKQIGFRSRLDRAHLLSAGTHPEFTYFPSNVRRIQHEFHERLDSYRDLVTLDPIDSNTRMWWCWRIATHSTEEMDPEIDYESKIVELIKADVKS